ncbi:response regulator [Nitrospira sp. BLG_2]|uniref:response regulator n=1 Tax=Nitrospira sp. BLG_2 TaxID=3397507 RepID=UPI003B9CE7EC
MMVWNWRLLMLWEVSPSLPGDVLLGSCPSRTAPLQLVVATGVVPHLGRGAARPDDAHIDTVKPSWPIQATFSSLDGETHRPQRALDPAQELGPNTNPKIDLRTTRSVLVVEDDPDITMALHDLLEFEGFHVDCVQTCRQAFSCIEQNIYNAVLLDLELPDGDGCSILEKLQVSHPSLPVIILTASNRDLGPLRPYARLAKPWKREELCGILHRAIGTSSS